MGMRYTKLALLTFGGGLALGLAVVVFALDPLARLASGVMALGIAALPAGLITDLWLAIPSQQRPAKTRVKAKAPARRRAPSPSRRSPRRRKPATPKR